MTTMMIMLIMVIMTIMMIMSEAVPGGSVPGLIAGRRLRWGLHPWPPRPSQNRCS